MHAFRVSLLIVADFLAAERRAAGAVRLQRPEETTQRVSAATSPNETPTHGLRLISKYTLSSY